MNIFPKLKKKRWAEINLDKESRKYKDIDFNNYNQCKKWVEGLHKKYKSVFFKLMLQFK